MIKIFQNKVATILDDTFRVYEDGELKKEIKISTDFYTIHDRYKSVYFLENGELLLSSTKKIEIYDRIEEELLHASVFPISNKRIIVSQDCKNRLLDYDLKYIRRITQGNVVEVLETPDYFIIQYSSIITILDKDFKYIKNIQINNVVSMNYFKDEIYLKTRSTIKKITNIDLFDVRFGGIIDIFKTSNSKKKSTCRLIDDGENLITFSKNRVYHISRERMIKEEKYNKDLIDICVDKYGIVYMLCSDGEYQISDVELPPK